MNKDLIHVDLRNKMQTWDEYFLLLCNTISSNSKCLSRKIGAVVSIDHSIISTGYNGPPRSIPSCSERWSKDEILKKAIHDGLNIDKNKCPRYTLNYKSGEGLHICVAGHAERNSLINAARHGIAVKGAIMYMNCPIPCSQCLVEIINAGISEIVVTKLEYYDEVSKYILKESGLLVRIFE